ncbi:MAG: VanZ family protein [Lachnospiraceae bacterium]|nr:VanZ family protein [Lachnospiraceae bacterium]MBQ8634352.1 VanZ family protein [Lachnospiraceae bacterium]
MTRKTSGSGTPSILIKLLSLVPTILLLFLIFNFSAQDGESSGSLSFEISLFLVRLASPLLPAAMSEEVLLDRAELIHYFVRKAAHMTEYFLLTLSLQLPLTAWFSNRLTPKLRILIGFAATVLFAALDEFHQTFVPGRSGNFTDVCIDSTGALIASLFLLLFYSIHQKKLAR